MLGKRIRKDEHFDFSESLLRTQKAHKNIHKVFIVELLVATKNCKPPKCITIRIN